MNLHQITLHKLSMRLKHPFHTSFGTIQDKEVFLIDVMDMDGRHGFGETVAFSSPWYTEETVETNFHVMRDFLIPLLREHPIAHPDEVAALFSVIRRNSMAKAALETAIWDLYAKQKEQTLTTTIGGTKAQIDVGISIGMQSTSEALIDKIHAALEQGFKRVKLKIKPGHDIELLRQVRQHFPELPLMADANSAYTLRDLATLKQLDEFKLMMIEQPLAHDDIVDHATLQREINTPICLDESICSYDDVRHAITLNSCQVINIKLGRVGGLYEAKRIHDLCAEHGLSVWCGGMLEAGVGRAHNIALSALPHFNLPGDTAGSSHYWEQDIISPKVIVHNGYITVPQTSGIGYEIDWDAVKSYRTAQWTYTI
ncbi:o-succinylbenzoate synthase [Ornithinibacillus gellani]|uniref:o-succinylbenzoate synthase n=1 Tax=Ornithinibacillus gellani TaxID=2293253 RepID=UPI000F4AAF63|nr:o-succinylbenzoate synthase [Ornithinibacillus gellani]TQS74735.1 o-succinylbenzoate synthase [Ornithinibacillus gellani]